MTEREKLYRRYAYLINRWQLFAGIYPLKEHEGSFLYRQIPLLAIASGAIMFFGVVRFCQDNINNLSLFTKGLSLIGSFALHTLRVLMFFIYRKQLAELKEILTPMFEETLANPQLKPILLSPLNLFRYPAYFYHKLITGTIILYVCTPLVFMGYTVIKDIHPRKYGLPFPTRFPWIDGTPGIYYQLEFLFEVQFGWFIVYVTSGVDSSFGFYVFQIVGILRARSYECENLESSSDELSVTLYNCIDKHIKLMRCRDIIQNIYGPIVFILALTSAVVLCGLTFQQFQGLLKTVLFGVHLYLTKFTNFNVSFLVKTEMTVAKTLLFIVYGVMKTTQTFMYALFGSILIAEGETFRNRIYGCKWYEFGKLSMMKGIILALTQQPMTLVACHLFQISLDMFLKILNTTISYYFLLQTFDEPDKH